MADDPLEQRGARTFEFARGDGAPDRPPEERIEAEAALIEKAKVDPLAFGELYEAHYSRILNYAVLLGQPNRHGGSSSCISPMAPSWNMRTVV